MRALTVAGEVHEADDHEHRVVVELELGVVPPAEAAAIVEHPEEDEAERAVEQELGEAEQPAEDEPVGLAGRAARRTRCRVDLRGPGAKCSVPFSQSLRRLSARRAERRADRIN